MGVEVADDLRPMAGMGGDAPGRVPANLTRIFLKATPEIEKYNGVFGQLITS